MIRFGEISEQEFLAEYWQKKPLLIKQALPNFISPIAADELAGLSLEEEFESRLITGSIHNNQWSLTNGPFTEDTFSQLSDQDWTLLVQGVDRFVDEVHNLIQQFDFIPRWRFDDVMISYAAKGGSVGPHFDYYDVFLLQGSGKRRWHISSKHCELDNYIDDMPLRIMNTFEAEHVWDVEPGDVLYVPPKVAHHGVSLDDECTTLSFGYRAYSTQEISESIDQQSEDEGRYYQDPIWNNENTPALIPNSAITQAQQMLDISADAFACFITQLDTLDIQLLQHFEPGVFEHQAHYQLHPSCNIAYLLNNGVLKVFINGELFDFQAFNSQVIIEFCNQRSINAAQYSELAIDLFKKNLIVIID
ncbi:MAG TPA: cupin domain-containing protein [Gammaproteobacteria bacterium]|nr:cupin domain-containing protein [Gammaproteobacteria bacterium]